MARTMNPITSRRLRDGMADSETDGRGFSRPAIQSHPSRLLPVSPVPVFCCNLSTGRGRRSCDHQYIAHGCTANTDVHDGMQIQKSTQVFSEKFLHLFHTQHLVKINCWGERGRKGDVCCHPHISTKHLDQLCSAFSIPPKSSRCELQPTSSSDAVSSS